MKYHLENCGKHRNVQYIGKIEFAVRENLDADSICKACKKRSTYDSDAHQIGITIAYVKDFHNLTMDEAVQIAQQAQEIQRIIPLKTIMDSHEHIFGRANRQRREFARLLKVGR